MATAPARARQDAPTSPPVGGRRGGQGRGGQGRGGRDRVTGALIGVGLALTVVAAVLPFLDDARLVAHHVAAGYPGYTPAEVDTAVGAWLVVLTVVGVLGAVGWLATAWALRRGVRGLRWWAAGLLLAGVGVALAGLTVQDTNGEVGLAPPLAWALGAPCAVGGVVVARLWRDHRPGVAVRVG